MTRTCLLAALPLALVATPVLAARAVKVIDPIAPAVARHMTVATTTVVIGEAAAPIVARLETKAADKRRAANLPPVDPAVALSPRPAASSYETLPVATMLPLEIEDVTRDWGLTSGQAVKLVVTVDTLKTADAGMGLLLGSSDELAGTVEVVDAASGARVGQFYVDVLNFRGGMLGMAIRGSGVREKLAAEFAKHVAEQLSGSKKKPGTAS